MSRSSLIDFQTRLAERLQAAQGTTRESRWLAVIAADRHLLVPLAQAGEISSYESPTPLPHARSWFLGLVNLRGALFGVVDLASFLGARTGAAPSSSRSRYVQFASQLDLNAVLLVDQLAGLRTAAQFSVDETDAEPHEPWLGPALRDPDGQRWRELNLALLAEDPRFLQVV